MIPNGLIIFSRSYILYFRVLNGLPHQNMKSFHKSFVSLVSALAFPPFFLQDFSFIRFRFSLLLILLATSIIFVLAVHPEYACELSGTREESVSPRPGRESHSKTEEGSPRLLEACLFPRPRMTSPPAPHPPASPLGIYPKVSLFPTPSFDHYSMLSAPELQLLLNVNSFGCKTYLYNPFPPSKIIVPHPLCCQNEKLSLARNWFVDFSYPGYKNVI